MKFLKFIGYVLLFAVLANMVNNSIESFGDKKIRESIEKRENSK